MNKNKKYLISILLLLLMVLLVGCSKKENIEDIEDTKDITLNPETYQENIDFESFYQNEQERAIAKSLIGKKAEKFEGVHLNGSVFDFKSKINNYHSMIKITNTSYINVQEDLKFKDSKTDYVKFYTVVTNIEDKDKFLEDINQDVQLDKDNDLIVMPDNNKDLNKYKANYPPMYYLLDNNGYIVIVLFGEQTNDYLTEIVNTYTSLTISSDFNLTEEDLILIKEGENDLIESIESGEFEEIDDYNKQIMNGEIVEEDFQETNNE